MIGSEALKVKQVAQELSDQGYKVLIEPSRSNIPFDLGGYRPDLIATKNDQGLIIEIKNQKYISVDKFQLLAKLIASHDGWRFILVPSENHNESVIFDEEKLLPSWQEIKTQLANVNNLIEQSQYLPAILLLSSMVEAILRKKASSDNLPIENFPPRSLVNHSFSSGVISLSEYDLLKDFFSLRNKIAHGVTLSSESIDLNQLKLVNDLIKSFVNQWSVEIN